MCRVIVKFIFRRYKETGTIICIKIQVICDIISETDTEGRTVERPVPGRLNYRIGQGDIVDQFIVHIVVTDIKRDKELFPDVKLVDQKNTGGFLLDDLVDQDGVRVYAGFSKIGILPVRIFIHPEHVFGYGF